MLQGTEFTSDTTGREGTIQPATGIVDCDDYAAARVHQMELSSNILLYAGAKTLLGSAAEVVWSRLGALVRSHKALVRESAPTNQNTRKQRRVNGNQTGACRRRTVRFRARVSLSIDPTGRTLAHSLEARIRNASVNVPRTRC